MAVVGGFWPETVSQSHPQLMPAAYTPIGRLWGPLPRMIPCVPALRPWAEGEGVLMTC